MILTDVVIPLWETSKLPLSMDHGKCDHGNHGANVLTWEPSTSDANVLIHEAGNPCFHCGVQFWCCGFSLVLAVGLDGQIGGLLRTWDALPDSHGFSVLV